LPLTARVIPEETGDHVTRWACDLKISSSKIIHRIATHKVSIVLTDVPD
jgi:hypothetical protein